MNIKHHKNIVLPLLLALFACKRPQNITNSPNFDYSGYTGLRSITTEHRMYTFHDTTFTAAVTWQLQYDGTRLTGAIPDTMASYLGAISLGYDEAGTLATGRRTFYSSPPNTIMELKVGFIYNGDGSLKSFIVNPGAPEMVINDLQYSRGRVDNIVFRSNSGGVLISDSSFRYVFDYKDNNISAIHSLRNDMDVYYTPGDLPNKFAGSLPAWLVSQLISEGIFVLDWPGFSNPNVVGVQLVSTKRYGVSRSSFIYKQSADGKVITRYRCNGYSSVPADSMIYQYY